MYCVASYNIKFDYPLLEEENNWKNRFPRIRKVFQRYDWDFGGLQEVTKLQLDSLKKMKEYTMIGGFRSDEVNTESCPIFFKKSKFSCEKSETFWLSSNPLEMSKEKGWGAECYRIVTWGLLQDIETNESFILLNTHFDHISEMARYQSAKLIIKTIVDLQNSYGNLPIFLTGDFNGDCKERYYKVITELLSDSFKKSPYHTGPFGTCTGVDFDPSFSWDQLLYIDYIFCSNGIKICESHVLTDKIQNHYPSDHFPIMIKCCL